MSEGMTTQPLDLLVVGAGPTGLAIGAAATKARLSTLLIDRGGLTSAIEGYPTDMVFFTTRERLEIAGIPFTIPDTKPNRRQALAYYREVARAYQIPLALEEEVSSVTPEGELFRIESRRDGHLRHRLARAVAIATGYFCWPRRLGVPGEDAPWVHSRFVEPFPHFGQDVVVVGGGNTAAEIALELCRAGARTTLVHRKPAVKPSVKYWLKPDFENRIEEGALAARFDTRVIAFHQAEGRREVEVEGPAGRERLPADAAYVLIGYRPEMSLLAAAGVQIDPVSSIPAHDPATCETNIANLFVAGTLQAGSATDKIFIENSRDHGERIVGCLLRRRT